MFCEARGWGRGCHVFYGDPKGRMSLELIMRGGGVTFFKGIQKEGGSKKILKTKMKIYRTPPLIKNDTSLRIKVILNKTFISMKVKVLYS